MPTIHSINFKVTINDGGNAAFGDSPSEVLSEIRNIIYHAIASAEDAAHTDECPFSSDKILFDSNGNKVGNLYINIEFDAEDEECDHEGEEGEE